MFIEGNSGHYSHYFNKLVIKTDYKYYLVPVYSFAAISLYHLLKSIHQTRTLLYVLIISLPTILTLSFCQLFELRYFIHPLMFMGLELYRPKRDTKTGTETSNQWYVLGLFAYGSYMVLHIFRDHAWWDNMQISMFL